MSTGESGITFLESQLATLTKLLALRLDREPPPGVPFEEFARQVLGTPSKEDPNA